VKSLAFAPKSDRLASGAADTTAILWDVAALLRDRRPGAVVLKPAQLDTVWADLASDNGDRAYQAVNALILSAEQATAFLKVNLRPVTGDGVAKLIARLDDDDFSIREQARAELARRGKAVESALRRALSEKPSAEVQRHLEELLNSLGQKRFVAEVARSLRGVEVLEAIGTAEAKDVLQGLAKGAPEAELTIEAKAALARLTR
jgi:hypothetical protein